MADIFADADQAFCGRFGLTLPVQHVSAETMAAILAALPAFPSPSVCRSGGGAANTANIAAGLGLKAAFFGCVGAGKGPRADRLGKFFKEELSQAGVFPVLRLGTQPTGVFLCLNVNGEKRIAASPSAALELRAEDLPDPALIRNRLSFLKKPQFQKSASQPAGTKPGAFLFEGFLLENNAVKKRCLEIAESSGLVPTFDPGTAAVAETYAEEILSWLAKYNLVLFVNEAEAKALAKVSRSVDWKPLFTRLTVKGGMVAVKLAEKGAAVFSGGGFFRAETRPVKTADTTGAGDAFAAGFLGTVLRGKTPEYCAREGNRVARVFLEGVRHSRHKRIYRLLNPEE
jgi:sugar/nucleoside kinase (ribokinase family)